MLGCYLPADNTTIVVGAMGLKAEVLTKTPKPNLLPTGYQIDSNTYDILVDNEVSDYVLHNSRMNFDKYMRLQEQIRWNSRR